MFQIKGASLLWKRGTKKQSPTGQATDGRCFKKIKINYISTIRRRLFYRQYLLFSCWSAF